MGKPKQKAGKKSKDKKVKKAAPRKAARRAPPVAAVASVAKTCPEYPWTVIVNKGHEKLPVTVADAAHLQRLVTEFGAEHVEVQS